MRLRPPPSLCAAGQFRERWPTQTGPLANVFGGKERLEQASHGRLIHAATCVGYRTNTRTSQHEQSACFNRVFSLPKRRPRQIQPKQPRRSSSRPRIEAEIQDYLLHQGLVCPTGGSTSG